jgi:hypothetical protein
MTKSDVKTYWLEKRENNIKNLEKKPANGGIPAVENKLNINANVNSGFDVPMLNQLIRYFGKNQEKPTAKISKEKDKIVKKP